MEELKKAVQEEMERLADYNIVYEESYESSFGFHYDVIAKISDTRYRIFVGFKSKVTGGISVNRVTANNKMLKAMSLR